MHLEVKSMYSISDCTFFPETHPTPHRTLHYSRHELQGIISSIPSISPLKTQTNLKPPEAQSVIQSVIQQLQVTLREVSSLYHCGQWQCVEDSCRRVLVQLAELDCQQKHLSMYKHSFQRLLGMAYLKQFQYHSQPGTQGHKTRNKVQLLRKARECLQYEDLAQSAQKKAKRLNNLGLCELFLQQHSKSFCCFSEALRIYQEDRSLNLLGLLKNLAQLYRQWEMYEQAVKIYKQIRSNNSLTQDYQHTIILRMLQCSNLTPNRQNSPYDPNGLNEGGRKDSFRLARTLLQKEHTLPLQLNLKLRFELIHYSLKWGVAEGDISLCEVDNLIRSVESYRPQRARLKFWQAYCYYIYRELYAFKDWPKYKEYTYQALKIFKSIYNQPQLLLNTPLAYSKFT